MPILARVLCAMLVAAAVAVGASACGADSESAITPDVRAKYESVKPQLPEAIAKHEDDKNCSTDLLGGSKLSGTRMHLYVLADCAHISGAVRITSNTSGAITRLESPSEGDYVRDFERLFPKDIRQKIKDMQQGKS